jgi:outer membrane lipoprotein-sorting protein
MRPRIAAFTAAAAVIVALLWGLSHFSGVFQGTPAFADVVAKMNKAETVTYRELYKVEGMGTFTTENMAMDTGLLRMSTKTGVCVIDFNKGITLQMNPSAKKAFVSREVGRSRGRGLVNCVDWIATLQNDRSGKFIGREKIDGGETNVFLVTMGEFTTIRVWTDLKTSLPIKIVWTSKHNPRLDVTVPKMTLYESDFGGEKDVSRTIVLSSTDGLQENSEQVYEDFKWNEKLDPVLFSTTPPKDYTVRESQLDVSDKGEKELVDALSTWAKMSQNIFPSIIADLNAADKVRPMLIKKYDGNGDPSKEFNEAMGEAHLLLKGLDFSQSMKAGGDWHYAGAGVKLGDKKTPVCWWKREGAQKYRILYGDLRVVDIDEADLPKAPQ